MAPELHGHHFDRLSNNGMGELQQKPSNFETLCETDDMSPKEKADIRFRTIKTNKVSKCTLYLYHV